MEPKRKEHSFFISILSSLMPVSILLAQVSGPPWSLAAGPPNLLAMRGQGFLAFICLQLFGWFARRRQQTSQDKVRRGPAHFLDPISIKQRTKGTEAVNPQEQKKSDGQALTSVLCLHVVCGPAFDRLYVSFGFT